MEIGCNRGLKLSILTEIGFEYYSDKLVRVTYRGQSDALWKQDFPRLFRKIYPTLILEKQEIIPYKDDNIADITYLLRKK